TFSPLPDAGRGPFQALLRADPETGRRLVGAVVDAATRSRIRLQEGYGEPELTVELEIGDGERRSYCGTDHVWTWYRRIGVGPGPALSALMALREWAAEAVCSQGVPAVLRAVLSCGDSIAFVAVALSI